MLVTSELNNLITTIVDSQTTLFILCGYPYAGKSFVAEEIRKNTNVVYVSIDAIFHAHGFDWDSNNVPDSIAWRQIFNESYEQIRKALAEGKNVLYDSTNQTIESRDMLRDVANSVGVDTRVIYVKSSMETVWKRWMENQQNPTRSVVNRELVQQTIEMFEEPTANENLIIINNL